MAIERRVKPTTRMMEELKRKRMIILAAIAGIAAFVVILFLVLTAYNNKKNQVSMDANEAALRTMLSAKTNYNGNWVAQPDGLFEVYLPGTPESTEGYSSVGITCERDTDYDNSCTRAYGVTVGEDRFDVGIFDDVSTVMSTIMPQVVQDIGKVHSGRNASGAYDLENVYMTDGRPAIKVSGDISVTVLLKEPREDDTFQESRNYPIVAYITLEKGFPVAVWGTYNTENVIASQEVPGIVEEVANTVWQKEYAGDKSEWKPVASTVGPDGVIIYEDDLDNPDTNVEGSNDSQPVETAEVEPTAEVTESIDESTDAVEPGNDVAAPENAG